MKQQPAGTSAINDIFTNAKTLYDKGEKRIAEITAQIAGLQKEQAAIAADNAKLKGILSAGNGSNGQAKATTTKGPLLNASGKIDGRSKEARAAKAAAAAKAAGKLAAKAPVKKVAAKKTAAKKATKTPAKKAAKESAGVSNATEGRRAVARGDRPPLKEAMATVMGKSTMGAAEILAGLEKKGWMGNAKGPQQYVSYMLSSNKDVFERVGRGQYRVRDGAVLSKKPKNAEAPAKKASSKKSSTDAELSDLMGPGVASNPFD